VVGVGLLGHGRAPLDGSAEVRVQRPDRMGASVAASRPASGHRMAL
jgi:hypothetical protein